MARTKGAMMMRWMGLVSAVVAMLAGSAWAMEPLTPATAATSRPSRFSIRSMPVLPAKEYSLEQLRQRWNAFGVNPDKIAGFSAVVLPFQVPAERREQLESLSNALAFLLSFDLDWADNCYNARHAYFVFKRNRNLVLEARVDYHPDLLAELAQRWRATHVIGGTIDGPDADHLTGTLRIHDPVGKLVKEVRYDTARPFAQLLGDMAVDSLRFVGYEPSKELTELLHRPRCQQNASLVALGSVGFVEERGEKEFGTYRDILRADPTFAEVRYWYANQSYWETKDRKGYNQEKLQAMRDHPVASAFEDIDMPGDPAERAEYVRWCDDLERMLGEEAPMCVLARMDLAQDGLKGVPALLDRAVAAARRNPHHAQLLHRVGYALIRGEAGGRGAHELDLAASLYLTSMASKGMPGNGFGYAASAAARAMVTLGYPDDALAVLSLEPQAISQLDGARAAVQSMHGSGMHWDAVEIAMEWASKDWVLAYDGAYSALITGQRERVEEAIRPHRELLGRAMYLPLLDALQKSVAGQKVDLRSLPEYGMYAPGLRDRRIECELVLALRQDERVPHEGMMFFEASQYPGSRMMAFLMAEYCARWKRPHCAGLEKTWAWLHPHDPLNARLAALQLPDRELRTAKELGEMLNAFEPRPWHLPDPEEATEADAVVSQLTPWHLAASLHAIGKQDPQAAQRLALQYGNAAAALFRDQVRGFSSHLVTRIRNDAGRVPPP